MDWKVLLIIGLSNLFNGINLLNGVVLLQFNKTHIERNILLITLPFAMLSFAVIYKYGLIYIVATTLMFKIVLNIFSSIYVFKEFGLNIKNYYSTIKDVSLPVIILISVNLLIANIFKSEIFSNFSYILSLFAAFVIVNWSLIEPRLVNKGRLSNDR